MRDNGQQPGPKSQRATGGDGERQLVEFDNRTVQKQGYSRHITLPRQGLQNLGVEPGDEVVCSLDVERGELVIEPPTEDEP